LRVRSLPRFYFYVVMAYDILRHESVQIGMRDYMAHVGNTSASAGDCKI